MSLSLSKTELAFIKGSREFTKEQARVLRYRINKKLKNQAKTDTDNRNQQLEHSSAVFGTFALRKWRQKDDGDEGGENRRSDDKQFAICDDEV